MENKEYKLNCIASASEWEFTDIYHSITNQLDKSIKIENKVITAIKKEGVHLDQSSHFDEGKDFEKVTCKEKSMVERNNDGPSMFVCQHCGKSFLNNNSLKQHLRNMHSPDREFPIVCEVCSKEYNKFTIKQHTKIHTEEVCKVCDKKYSKRNLFYHMQKAHLNKDEER